MNDFPIGGFLGSFSVLFLFSMLAYSAFLQMRKKGRKKVTKGAVFVILVFSLAFSAAAAAAGREGHPRGSLADRPGAVPRVHEEEAGIRKSVTEQPTSEQSVKENADILAQALNWNDFEDVLQNDPGLSAVNTEDMTWREKFDQWMKAYDMTSYEETFGYVDPVTDQLIDSYGQYQNYIMSNLSNL